MSDGNVYITYHVYVCVYYIYIDTSQCLIACIYSSDSLVYTKFFVNAFIQDKFSDLVQLEVQLIGAS